MEEAGYKEEMEVLFKSAGTPKLLSANNMWLSGGV
jgi:hypothetical protein